MKKNNKATLLIAGHTDNVGDNAVNDALSKKRAESAKKYLISLGVDSSRISVESYGERMPKFLNSNAYGKQLNRRVEIFIKDK